MKVPGSIAFDIESRAGEIRTEGISHQDLHLGPSSNLPLVLVERRGAGTQPPFLDSNYSS